VLQQSPEIYLNLSYNYFKKLFLQLLNKNMKLIIIILTFLITSCSNLSKIPSDQTNACSILKEKRSWYRALQNVEKKWGVSKGTQLSFILTESNFRPRAKTQRTYVLGVIPKGRLSSAFGYAQVIDSTWQWYKESTGNKYASRTTFRDSTDFIGWYFNETQKKLKISKKDVYNQYLAYHQGHQGFKNKSYKNKLNLLKVAKNTHKKSIIFDKQIRKCN